MKKLTINRESLLDLEAVNAGEAQEWSKVSPQSNCQVCTYYFTCRPSRGSYCQTKVAE